MKTVIFMFLCFNFAACIAKYIMSLISVDNLVGNRLAEINVKLAIQSLL
jgi:hypothetical protein